MRLTYNYNTRRFVAVVFFQDRDIPRSCGFKFCSQAKEWCTSNYFDAEKFSKLKGVYTDDFAINKMMELLQVMKNDILMSHSNGTDGFDMDSLPHIPHPPGMELRPYQKIGAAFALKNGRALIGDDMGLGKTIQAIGVINSLPGLRSVLVVVPKAVKLNWLKELRTWLTNPLTVAVAGSKRFPQSNIVIINYDILDRHPQIIQTNWDLLIADEAHRVKNRSTQRAKSFNKITAQRVIALSGTPIPNHPQEFYNLFKYLRPDVFPSRAVFDAELSNLHQFNMRIRKDIMIRRLKSDVLKDLPDKSFQIIELEGHSSREELAILEQLKHIDDPTQLMQEFNRLRLKCGLMDLMAQRQRDTLAKLPDCIELHKEFLDSCDRKLIIFAHHRAVIEGLEEALRKYGLVKIIGGQTPAENQDAVDRFQNDASIRVFLGSIKAAGEGITLTAASDVDIIELDWNPGGIQQAIDRAHRIGQKNAVNVRFLLRENSLDSFLANKIAEKDRIINQAIN